MCLRGDEEIDMAKKTYRKRVPKGKRRDHKGLPQTMVVLSGLPEFGGRARSLTTAYKYCAGEFVSAPMERIMREAKRRLGLQEGAAA